MGRWGKVLLGTVLLILLISCGGKTYEEALQEGRQALEQEQYDEAEQAFREALQLDKNNEVAATLLQQTQLFQRAVARYTEGKLPLAKEIIEEVGAIEDGSEVLGERIEMLGEEIEQLEEHATTYREQYEAAKKQFDSGKYKEALTAMKKLLDQDLSHAIFADLQQKLQLLHETAEHNVGFEKERKKSIEKAEKERKEVADKALKQVVGYWLHTNQGEACHVTKTYWACAVPFSDAGFHEQIANIVVKKDKEFQVIGKSGHVGTIQISDKDTLTIDGRPFKRSNEKEANGIYDGHYSLP